ncbi:unnamed protein product, partial [marine sediment metagenome]
SPIDWEGKFILINEITTKFKEHINEESDQINIKWMGRALKRLNLLVDKRRKAKGREVLIDFNKARKKVMIFKPRWDGKDRRKVQDKLSFSDRRRSKE